MSLPAGTSGAAGTWWVVQEGLAGDIIDKLSTFPSGSQALDVTWHVVQDATRPNSSAQGPYATQAAAQAQANTLNGKGPGSDSGSVVAQAAGATGVAGFLDRLGSANLWERVALVALGIVLIAAGVAKLTNAVPIATKIAGVVK